MHIPVLLEEVLEGLSLSPDSVVIDGTVGLGGHAEHVLEATAPNGRLFAFDRDDRNLAMAKERLERFNSRVDFIHDSFANIESHELPAVDAALFDLGYSSVHVDDASRGFSFQNDGPLDMRYDTRQEITAEMVVNQLLKEELAEIIRTLGEEEKANQIADAIVRSRRKERITSTVQLADIIASVVRKQSRVHPATKTFQALRMTVNDELGQIEQGMEAAIRALRSGGRIVVITFHSIEDRLVKGIFKNSEAIQLVNKKVIQPNYQEKQKNPRSRSAKLRIAEKV